MAIDENKVKKLTQALKDVCIKQLLLFSKEIVENSKKYIPEHTGSLAKQNYIIRGESGIKVGFGSKFGDQKLNAVAIKQHSEALYHYGSPKGQSMRRGFSETKNIQMYEFGHSRKYDENYAYKHGKRFFMRKKSNQYLTVDEYLSKQKQQPASNTELTKQMMEYVAGYMDKREDGELTKYPAKYLEKGLKDTLKNKARYLKNIKLPKGVL